MGFDVAPDPASTLTRQEILERLGRSEIDVKEASRLLATLGKR